jgi:hypothetical protein
MTQLFPVAATLRVLLLDSCVASLHQHYEMKCGASAAAATRNSPSIPTRRVGPRAGLSRGYIPGTGLLSLNSTYPRSSR